MKAAKGKVAVLTSGGDAPGMNAAIRAAVRKGLELGYEMWGARCGLEGLVNGVLDPLSSRSVSNIIQRGGTILHTARSPRFMEPAGRKEAADVLRRHAITGLVAIGGDGTFRGLIALAEMWDGTMVGVPGTVDNDLFGTDYTIGFDTAVNTALEAIDRIRDTASAHDRIFLVEVMGRHAGFIAVAAGVAGGAEHILIPETPTDLAAIGRAIIRGREAGKTSQIIIVAEGDEAGGAIEVGKRLEDLIGISFRVCVLGHIQRGGSPSATDRILATVLGAYAMETLHEGITDQMVGMVGGRLCRTPLTDAVSKKKDIDPYLLALAGIMAT